MHSCAPGSIWCRVTEVFQEEYGRQNRGWQREFWPQSASVICLVSREIGEHELTDEKLPQKLSLTADLLHNIDPSGKTFRYPDRDLMRTLDLDIGKLSADLSRGHRLVMGRVCPG